jgi:hypothetical protein
MTEENYSNRRWMDGFLHHIIVLSSRTLKRNPGQMGTSLPRKKITVAFYGVQPHCLTTTLGVHYADSRFRVV